MHHQNELVLFILNTIKHSDVFLSSVLIFLIMPPTSKKLTGHISFGLCVHTSTRASVRSRTVHARVLKFHILIPHGKLFDTGYFLVRVSSLSGVMPPLNKI